MGVVLLMISGILTLLVALGLIVFSVLVFTGIAKGEGNMVFGGTVLLIIGIIVLIVAFLKFWASKLMKNPITTSKGGVIALIVGIIGGGDLLAIIGGILGLVQGGKN